MIAQVVFNLPLDRAFDYVVPEAWGATIQRGLRVEAPFGPRRLIGYVTAVRDRSAVAHPKDLLRLIDPQPVLTVERWDLAAWLAEAYCCSLGEACAAIVPTHLRLRPDVPEEAAAPATAAAPPPFELTAGQRHAYAQLEPAIAGRRFGAFLLHGVTGSGKTELYLRAIARAREQGRGAICLVPEIALTPQAIDRFRGRFGDEVAVWHSRLTARQRAQEWTRLARGRRRIVVGTRSAVFAPVADLGVVILDEEHDPSYKQEETPRYHAREAALARARQSGAVVLLGSATPSVESYYEAGRGRLRLLELKERVHGRALPHVEVIDMRQELSSGRRRMPPLSLRLQRAIEHVVTMKEQAILLLNRRGFARLAQCHACGMVVRCRRCDVPLIYHASLQRLACHYCNLREAVAETCPSCRRGYVKLRGTGTERIESELSRLFPGSGIARMDRDSTAARESHRRLYDLLTTQQIDLLVGTQMVAKGWDVPQVTLVGVVSADTALNLPDFRAGERTFNLLTQAGGRAGRGERPGKVLIQTFCPAHYAIQAASRHDYAAFYRAEIAMRRRLRLPPFVHLVELTVQGRARASVEQAAEALRDALHRRLAGQRIRLLGPAPHRIASLRGTWRWHLVLKGKTVPPMLKAVRETLQEGRRFRGLPVIVDVDPR